MTSNLNRVVPPFFLALSLCVAPPAQAGPITYVFGGQLTSVASNLSSKFHVGENFFGQFTYETSTKEESGNSNNDFAVYDALTDFSVNFGDAGLEYQAMLDQGSLGLIEVFTIRTIAGQVGSVEVFPRRFENLIGEPVDCNPRMAGCGPTTGQLQLFAASVLLDNSTGTLPFNSAIPLPTSLPRKSFTSEVFTLIFGTHRDSQETVSGRINTRSQIGLPPHAMPEPASLTLFTLGAGCVAVFRRRKRS